MYFSNTKTPNFQNKSDLDFSFDSLLSGGNILNVLVFEIALKKDQFTGIAMFSFRIYIIVHKLKKYKFYFCKGYYSVKKIVYYGI